MKKISLILLLYIMFCFPASAMQENNNNSKPLNSKNDEIIELKEEDKQVPLEDITIEEDDFKSKLSKYYSLDKRLFKIHVNDYLNVDFGAIGNINWITDNQDQHLHSNYHFDSIDIRTTGKINEYIDYRVQFRPHRNINKKTILGDVWLRGNYKNYSVRLGRMHKPFAFEPGHSSYRQDFSNRSQIGEMFGDHRDTGGKITASYKYADVAMGLFASMQDRPFWFSHHGIEFDSSLTLKPLANIKNKGNLQLIESIAIGKRDYSYTNFSSYISYEYKKFGLKSEFINKEASFYDEKTANGYYITGTYFLTDKLQGLVRFDSCNPDSKNSSRRTNEYTAGLNYYLNKQNTMLALNYIYSDGIKKAHKIVLQMRYKTW